MKMGDGITMASVYVSEKPLPLLIPRSLLTDKLREGDIVTIAAEGGGPTREIRTGIPVPTSQRFIVVAKEDE